MDPLALNYFPGANMMDPNNPCCYIIGCTNQLVVIMILLACFDDGSCVVAIYGCTDITAMNYNANACVDDGSCAYSNNCLNPTPTGTHATDIHHVLARVKWDNEFILMYS